jgi:serine/threonine protein kinase
MALAPGTQVTPTVRLLELLGTGGMGSVWVAEHTALRTKVAVKFVSAELVAEDATIGERFNREASLSAQIKSPYAVQTYDHGMMADGQAYIVMELLEGESLGQRLTREPRLSTELCGLIVTQASKALSKAHKLGIVHRDIKPDNLFLTYDDDEMFLKVLDFGIAKQTGIPQAESVTTTGMMVGTPQYMSPEQVLSARSVDHRADLWALAVVAYHCLSGAVPFDGETRGSLCVAIANGELTPPSQHRPELSEQVDRWFKCALAKKPENRFDSAKQLALSFSMALTGQLADDFSVSGLRPPDWSGGQGVLSTSAATAAMSPTFAGTTTTEGSQPRKARSLALIGLTVAALAGGGTVALLMVNESDPTTGAAETNVRAEETAAATATAAAPVSAEPASEPSASATPAQPEPSASASASSKTLASPPPTQATSKMGHGKLPKSKATAAPDSKSKDRGF